LLARGERVVRVPPKLMACARDSTREPGKSDRIDAVAVARAAIREGLETLPVAQLAGAELDIRLLVDHRDRLVKQRTALINDLRWQLHDPGPSSRSRFAPSPVRVGSNASPGDWRAPSSPRASESRATSSTASATSRARSRPSSTSSPRSSSCSRRGSLLIRAAGR
jgi:hypothetical protein